MSEHKARAAAKFRRPTKALAVQKFDFKYLFEPATSFYTAGMCDVFNRITPANVRIVYTQPASRRRQSHERIFTTTSRDADMAGDEPGA